MLASIIMAVIYDRTTQLFTGKTALPVLDAVARATADHLAHHSMCSQLAAAGSPKVGRTQRTNAKLRAQFVSAANSACGFNALSAIREVRR